MGMRLRVLDFDGFFDQGLCDEVVDGFIAKFSRGNFDKPELGESEIEMGFAFSRCHEVPQNDLGMAREIAACRKPVVYGSFGYSKLSGKPVAITPGGGKPLADCFGVHLRKDPGFT